jgi:hypothetical protein
MAQIMCMLRIGKLHHQRALVLGAFGCGVRSSCVISQSASFFPAFLTISLSCEQAFHNPPTVMARLFRRALTEMPEFHNAFDEIVFAILERNGSDNMRPWREAWKGLIDDGEGDAGTGQAQGKESGRGSYRWG